MSTERNELTSNNSEAISVTSFSGGKERGRCLQLTQAQRDTNSGWSDMSYVQLDKEQAMLLVADITRWLAGE